MEPFRRQPAGSRAAGPDPARPDLEALRPHLAARPEVRLAVVFGSWARGQGRLSSDLDLLLDLDPDSDGLRRALEPTVGRLARWRIDIVHAADAPPQLRLQVARHGLLLVERHPGDWVRFKTAAMVDWWDWAPTARRIHAAAVRRLREETQAYGRR
jgi:predicted nucleotidyltransferase